MILMIVDAHSFGSAAMTCAPITELRQTFADLSLPNTIVSDNGSCFTSDEFEQFCQMFTVSSFKQWVGRYSSTNREGGLKKTW